MGKFSPFCRDRLLRSHIKKCMNGGAKYVIIPGNQPPKKPTIKKQQSPLRREVTAKTTSKKPDDQVPIVEFTTSSTSAYINLSILSEFGSISTLSINDYFIIGDEGLDGVSDWLV